jgi:hypothetical protein
LDVVELKGRAIRKRHWCPIHSGEFECNYPTVCKHGQKVACTRCLFDPAQAKKIERYREKVA